MSAKQANALSRNPNGINLVQVSRYERRIRANIHRVWENVLDWEHLPSLHETSFDYVSLDDGGPWGWRTWSNPERSASVELTVNREANEYVARSYNGAEQISEIWTRLTPVGEETDIEVTFELPDIADDQVNKLGKLMLGLYTQLWDEDEAMMIEREKQLQRKYAEPAPTELELSKPVSLPQTIELGRGSWTIRELSGELIVHSAICPHLLGPLDHQAKTEGDLIRCPWHGYDFNMRTGQCVKPENASCGQLKAPPIITETESSIILKLS